MIQDTQYDSLQQSVKNNNNLNTLIFQHIDIGHSNSHIMLIVNFRETLMLVGH